jgi:hypothetical protein
MLVLDGMCKKRYVISYFKSTHNTRQIRAVEYLFKVKTAVDTIRVLPLVPGILPGILNRRLCLQGL